MVDHSSFAANEPRSMKILSAWSGRIIVGLLATLLALGVLTVSKALAADIGGQLTNIVATATGPSNPTQNNSAVYTLTYDACVPAAAQTGDSWAVTLPTQLGKWPTGFNINDPQNASVTWIKVSIVNGVATYTLTPEGAAKAQVSGGNFCFKSEFGGTLNQGVSLGQHDLVIVTQGGADNGGVIKVGTINVVPPSGSGFYAPTKPAKTMWFATGDHCRTNPTACLVAGIVIPAGDHGLVTITETSGPTWTFNCNPAERLHRLHL